MPRLIRCVLLAALLLCLSSGAAFASTLSPGQSWAGDGSTGDLSQWSYVEQCPGDISVVDSPAPAGGHAFKLQVADGDVESKCPGHVFTPQPAASLISPTVFHNGDEAWVGFSVYFPAGFPTIPHWFQFAELDGRPFGGSPPVGLDIEGDRLGLYRDATHNFDNPWSAPLVTGEWEDFVLHVKFSTDPTVGFVELYYNGVQQQFSDGSTRLYYATLVTGNNFDGTTGDYLDLDQYRSMYDSFGSLTIYEAEAAIGNSYSAVAPQLHYGIVKVSSPAATTTTPTGGGDGSSSSSSSSSGNNGSSGPVSHSASTGSHKTAKHVVKHRKHKRHKKHKKKHPRRRTTRRR